MCRSWANKVMEKVLLGHIPIVLFNLNFGGCSLSYHTKGGEEGVLLFATHIMKFVKMAI